MMRFAKITARCAILIATLSGCWMSDSPLLPQSEAVPLDIEGLWEEVDKNSWSAESYNVVATDISGVYRTEFKSASLAKESDAAKNRTLVIFPLGSDIYLLQSTANDGITYYQAAMVSRDETGKPSSIAIHDYDCSEAVLELEGVTAMNRGQCNFESYDALMVGFEIGKIGKLHDKYQRID